METTTNTCKILANRDKTPNSFTHDLARTFSRTELRPWPQLLDPKVFTLPFSFDDSLARLHCNLHYFRANYARAIVAAVAIGVVLHPASLITAFIVTFGCISIYCYGDRIREGVKGVTGEDAGVYIHQLVDDDKASVGVFAAALLAVLLFSGVLWNVCKSVFFGTFVVGLHAVFRLPDCVVPLSNCK